MAHFDPEWHDALPSTNDRALELARSGADRIAVLARTQTAGRGRRGRTWSSPEGRGLYASFVARPPISAARAPLLTLACGVAVHDAFATRVRGRLGLKWPNDVLASAPPEHAGKKLAGILVESATAIETLEYAIFGIGVNLAPAAHADLEAAQRAVSLQELGGEPWSAEEAFETLAHALGAQLDRAASGDVGFVPAEWEARALAVGAVISVAVADELVSGRLVGLAPDGGLRIATREGERTLHSGEVDPRSLV